jgi:hypothetical protein
MCIISLAKLLAALDKVLSSLKVHAAAIIYLNMGRVTNLVSQLPNLLGAPY